MLMHNFCRNNGRLVKLLLFSTLLDKSPLTSIYFATFEKKREVRSPLPTQSMFLVFGKFHLFGLYEYVLQLSCILLSINVKKIESRTKCHKSDTDKMPQNENRTKCHRIRMHQNCNNKSYNSVTKVRQGV